MPVLLSLLLHLSCALPSPSVLVWSDEFESPGIPDSNRWSWDVGGSGMGNHERQLYTASRRANAVVDSGQLILTAHREDTGTCWYGTCRFTSARLTTRGRFAFRYGRIEVRAKLPQGRGLWPGIWMLPEGAKHGAWPNNGEIDLMEQVGYEPEMVHATVHTAQGPTGAKQSLADPRGWHTYGMDWSPDSLVMWIDSQPRFRYLRTGDWKQWPFDQPFHLLLNLAVGGSWGGLRGIDTSIFPQSLRIDWARIWKLDRGTAPQAVPLAVHGKGQVHLQPAQSTIPALTPVTATADPAPGWELLQWEGALSGNRLVDRFLADPSDTLVARFVPKDELIWNPDFAAGRAGWIAWNEDTVPTEFLFGQGGVRLRPHQAGAEAWMSQFDWVGLRLEAGEQYELTLHLQASRPRPFQLGLRMNHPPYAPLARGKDTLLTGRPQVLTHRFTVERSDPSARLELAFGTDTTAIRIQSVSLRRIGLAATRRP